MIDSSKRHLAFVGVVRIKKCKSFIMIIIAEGNISGRAFLQCSKEDWTKLNISVGGIYTLMDLQKEVSNHSFYREEETKSLWGIMIIAS